MLEKITKLFEPSPEQRARTDLLKKVAAASAYYNAISEHVGPDHKSSYDEEIRRELVKKFSLQWLTNHGREVFPGIDEFEVEKDWIINHPDHEQREDHQRFTMQQLGAWIDAQKHNIS